MTIEEFELGYVTRSGITIGELHALGLRAQPCDCGEDMCEGWEMSSPKRRIGISAPGGMIRVRNSTFKNLDAVIDPIEGVQIDFDDSNIVE